MERKYFETHEDVARTVRERRRHLGWTQTALAEKASVSVRLIGSLEAGHERAEIGKILRVLAALEIAVVALPGPERVSQTPEGIDLDKVLARFD